MPSNLIHMAIDSIIEGENLDVVVNRVLLVEKLSDKRTTQCQTHSYSGYGGTGKSSLKKALSEQKNNGGPDSTTTHGRASFSKDGCNPEGETVGKGVVRRTTATSTSYQDECELINPPTTTESYNTQEKTGVSTLVEINWPVENFVVMRLHKVPEKELLAHFREKNHTMMVHSIYHKLKSTIPSMKIQNIDTKHAPDEVSAVLKVADRKTSQVLQRILKKLFYPLKKSGSSISLIATENNKFNKEVMWSDEVVI